MTVECISEENGKIRKFFPIDINKENIANVSRNLSKFQYKFGEIQQVTVIKAIKGMLMLNFDITNGYVKMATMGSMQLIFGFIFIKSYNKYDGQHADAELCLLFHSNKKQLLLIIPMIKTSSKSHTSNFFKQLTTFDDNNNSETFSISNFSLEDLIPQSEFYYYPNVVLSMFSCDKSESIDAIIFPYDKAITINNVDYNRLANYSGNIIENYTESLDGQDSPPKDMDDNLIKKHHNQKKNYCYESCKTIDYEKFYINKIGTKNGPGFENDMDDEVMECEAILDQDDNPIGDFNRLDWVKNTIDDIDPKFKNYFFLFVLCIVLAGALVFLHSFVFKQIGKLLGSEDIVTRSSSMS
jgi:carbonic anhydrase